MGTDWWSPGQRWLEQQASKEADAQKRAWIKGGRSAKTFRYNPPEWHRDAVAALGRNDEETFKAIKLGQLGTRGLPPLRGAKTTRQHATKKSPAQLQREINEALAKPASVAHGSKLVAIARAAAAHVLSSRKAAPSPASVKKAKEAAFKAILRHDPLAGTSDHPHAAHAHGVAELAAEGVEQAARAWVPARQIRHGTWAKAGNKIVSHDKRFSIMKDASGYNLIDLDTYNEYPAASLDEAKSRAARLRY